MDPILRAIHYVFEKNNKTLKDDTIELFVNNDIKFPEFVALAFNIEVEDIPGFNPNPTTSDDEHLNRCHAIEYIFNHNDNVNKIGPIIGSNLLFQIILSYVLIDQCFNINESYFIIKCNSILCEEGYHIEKDLYQEELIFLLLKVLVNKKNPEDIKSNELCQTLTAIFEKAKIPLIIDDSCYKIEKQFLFLIQIEIILNTFGYLDKSIPGNYVYPIDYFTQYNKLKENNYLSLKFSACKSFERKDFTLVNHEDIEQEKAIDKSILDTISAIGKIKIAHFEYDCEKIINILQILFKKDETEQNILKNINYTMESTERKLELIVNHLKTKNSKFKALQFDFKNPIFIESSTITLYTNILDSFFLKKSKEELYDRCYTLLYGKYIKCPPYDDIQGVLYNWSTYVALINFINDDKAKIKLRKNKLKNNKKQIPIVISENYLELCPKNYIPNAIYYQLQFIFDALDNSDFQHRLIEYFIITIRKFSQIEIPPTDTIASCIRAKNISLILQNKRYKKNIQKNNEKFQNKHQRNSQVLNNNQTLENNQVLDNSQALNNDITKHIKESIEINNAYENSKQVKKIYFEDGILYEEGFKNGGKAFNKIINFMCKEEINTTDNNYESTSQFEHYDGFIYNKCALFNYIESLKQWQFEKKAFEEIIYVANKNNYKKITLILYLESKLIQHFKINDICIVGIWDQYIIYNSNNSKVIPLSMFLSVPENKKNLPNIKDIVFQIYFFLSLISDLNIVILDKEMCIEQHKIIQKIINLKNSFSKDEFTKNGLSLLDKQMKFLMLINDDDNLHKTTQDIKNIKLFNELTGKICYMNIYETDSNDNTLINNDVHEIIQQLTIESTFKLDDITNIFSFIKYFPMDNYYIDWNFNDRDQEHLTLVINNSINELITNNNNFFIFNPEFSLTKLRDAIYKTYPVVDSTYHKKCIELTELKEKFYLDIRQYFINELKEHAKECINDISQAVNSKLYWSNEQIDNIKYGYIELLKDKFFNIIQNNYPKNVLFAIYDENEDILNSQIATFNKKIKKKFKKVKQQNQICEKIQEIDIKKGTNYTIRETENEREVKARIEHDGKLEDLIEQDF